MTIFTMFFIELMAARFDVFGEAAHDIEANDPSTEVIRGGEKYEDTDDSLATGKAIIFPLSGRLGLLLFSFQNPHQGSIT